MRIIGIINPHNAKQLEYADTLRVKYGTYLTAIYDFTPQVQEMFKLRTTPAIIVLPDALQGENLLAEDADGNLIIDALLAGWYDQDSAMVYDQASNRADLVIQREVDTVAAPLRESIGATQRMLTESFTATGDEIPIALARVAETIGIEPKPDGKAWEPGEYVPVGAVRVYGDVNYAVKQAHITQPDWTPDIVPALWRRASVEGDPAAARPWVVGEAVTTGWLRTYINGVTYRCVQGHTTQAGWEPPNLPALWEAVK